MPYRLHILLVVFCLLVAGLTQAAPPIHLAAGEWPPFAGKSLPDHGVACRIIDAAFAESGLQVEYSFLSWRRGLELAKRGKLDGAILWAAPPPDDPEFVGSSVVIVSEVVILHRRSVPVDVAHLEGAAHAHIGYPHGYGYEDIPAFKALLSNANPRPVEFNEDRDAVQAVLNGRIDLYPIDRLVARYMLEQYGPSHWRTLVNLADTPISKETLVVVISKSVPDHDRIIASLNHGLSVLRAKGLTAKWLAEAAPTRAMGTEIHE